MLSLRSFQADGGALLRGLSTLAVDRHLISAEVCRDLELRGFAVVDNCFGEDISSSLRAEVVALRDHMHANCTHLVNKDPQGHLATTLLPKRNIFEAELLLPQTQALAPLCSQIQHDTTLRVMLNVLVPDLRLGRHAIKMQWNSGSGACFPMHFDTDAAVDGRKVTSILYLNPGWTRGSGGQLRVYPFPQPPVDIEPFNDRLVLFSSQRMLHRVLPSLDERYCITIWLSERQQPGRGGEIAAQREALRDALSRGAEPDDNAAWQLLLSDELRPHAAKIFYRQEWARSLEESHPPGAERDALLAAFSKELGVIEKALKPLLPALRRGAASGREVTRWF